MNINQIKERQNDNHQTDNNYASDDNNIEFKEFPRRYQIVIDGEVKNLLTRY